MLAALRALLPGGDHLRADEIVAVRASMRSLMPASPIDSGAVSGEVTVPLQGARRARRDDGPTPNTLANAQIEARGTPRRAAAPVAVAIAATVLGILAVGVIRTMQHDDGAAPSVTAPASSASSPASRRANLVIFPLDAAVEIDGAMVAAQDGVVELNGALGSVHRVKVSKNGQEKLAEVVLGEAGAEPPKVELALAAPAATTAASATARAGGGGPIPKKTASPSAPGTPAAPTKNPLIPERFE